MGGNNKYYKAVLLSTKLYIWLYKNPDKDKMESPYWERISNMLGNCPLCECHEGWCSPCILFKHGACRNKFMKRLNSKHVAFYYAFDFSIYGGLNVQHIVYKKKCARAFIAAKLRRELRRLKIKGVKGE